MGVKRPRRLFVLAALCGTVALAGWIGAGLAGLDSLGVESTGAPIEVGPAATGAAQATYVDGPRAAALGEHGISGANIAIGGATLSDTPTMTQPAAPPVPFAAVSPTDPVQTAVGPAESADAVDACPEQDVCVDQYLWSLYERTPKVDTVKMEERIKVKVKNKKGKTRTVVKTLTKYITEDFG